MSEEGLEETQDELFEDAEEIRMKSSAHAFITAFNISSLAASAFCVCIEKKKNGM